MGGTKIRYPDLKCCIDGCHKGVHVKLHMMCSSHYERFVINKETSHLTTLEKKRKAWDKRRSTSIKQYILDKKIGETENGCWIAKSSVKPPRYVPCEYYGEKFLLHRKSYEIFKGPIPSHLIVRHKCDNTVCFNPDHLELGTKKDNRQDFMKRFPNALEFLRESAKNAAKGSKRFWDSMSKSERETFIKTRAEKQRMKRIEKQKSALSI